MMRMIMACVCVRVEEEKVDFLLGCAWLFGVSDFQGCWSASFC